MQNNMKFFCYNLQWWCTAFWCFICYYLCAARFMYRGWHYLDVIVYRILCNSSFIYLFFPLYQHTFICKCLYSNTCQKKFVYHYSHLLTISIYFIVTLIPSNLYFIYHIHTIYFIFLRPNPNLYGKKFTSLAQFSNWRYFKKKENSVRRENGQSVLS